MSYDILDKTVFGNKRCYVLSFNASGAEENITTGLQVVDHFSVGIKSAATFAYTMQHNKNSSGTASNGMIGCSGLAAGDEMFIYVYGK